MKERKKKDERIVKDRKEKKIIFVVCFASIKILLFFIPYLLAINARGGWL